MCSLLRILTISLLFVAAAACPSVSAKGKTVHTTSESGVLYELTFESGAPEAMQPLPVRIKLSGPGGAPISGTKILCSLSMPAMAMTRNAPTIKETSTAGHYEGIFLLTMGGYGTWNSLRFMLPEKRKLS